MQALGFGAGGGGGGGVVKGAGCPGASLKLQLSRKYLVLKGTTHKAVGEKSPR